MMSTTIIIGALGVIVSIIGIVVRIWLSRRNKADEIEKDAAEASDNIRARAQDARTQHEVDTPRRSDDDLNRQLDRLRAAINAARKTR